MPSEVDKNVEKYSALKEERTVLGSALYPKLGVFLWKSVEWFLCNPNDEPTDQPSWYIDTAENAASLAEVKKDVWVFWGNLKLLHNLWERFGACD